MERHDLLYRLYDEFDTERLREYQQFVDLFPPVDSRVALEHWQNANEELEERKDEIRSAFAVGETFAEIAARANRDQAFAALDLHAKYDRAVNVLVLDVDETLRSAGGTDNEIPRDVLHVLTEFHETGVPIVICTGQTLENVKGFMIQGLGSEIVHSGDLSIVYEAGTGVFTPGHGADTKQLLYEDLDAETRSIFDNVRARVLPDAPDELRRGCHLQGNEFNVTLKPNFETGSDRAREVIDDALVYLLDLLGAVVVDELDASEQSSASPASQAQQDADERSSSSPASTSSRQDADAAAASGDDLAIGAAASGDESAGDDAGSGAETASDRNADVPTNDWARAFYGDADPEIRRVLERAGRFPDVSPDDVPDAVAETFDRIDVAYYEADAAEIGSLELNKVVGVEAALGVLGIDDPFALVMGDSKSDRRVMEWVAENDAGIAAAPKHASQETLEHVLERDELVFGRGQSAEMLRTAYALNQLAGIP